MRRITFALLLASVAGCSSGTPVMMQNQNEFSYSLTPFTLAPGAEQIQCYYVAADGKEKYVNRFITDMNPGSHHLIVMRIDETRAGGNKPPAGPADCVDIPAGFDGMLPGSQQLHSDFPLPDGVAMKVSATHGLYFQSHYINATSSSITTGVTWKLETVEKAKVQQIAGIVFYSNWALSVPPGMSQATVTCPAPQDMSLVTGTGHMHKRGIAFDATLSGTNIFHTNNWDEPDGAIYASPGLTVKTGDNIVWTCTYDNTTSTTFHFGNSAAANEMCIFAAGYYPSVDGETIFNDGSCH
jgi:Copper type II ascorbate-dependent monooxygenase, C-terminal domain